MLDDERVQYVTQFKAGGYRDYTSARILYLNDMLLEGTVLASTAVEKYIKSVMAYFGKKKYFHLDKAGILDQIDDMDPRILEGIDRDYLSLLGKVYKSRYYDDMPDGQAFGLHKNKMLAELDYSVIALDDRVRILQDGIVISGIISAMKSGQQEICKENYMYRDRDKKRFVEQYSYAQFVIVKEGGGLMEVVHPCSKAKLDDSFNRGTGRINGNEITVEDFFDIRPDYHVNP